ncbi:hypothetical protein E2L00_00405 [Cedecea colo]|uniref:Secreted protein n=1 Tax=Cedecea colo TaxID=2552946 RepID=A0ABX0VHA7_9ENTR|nr:hypothetical protein [Cedecea colo]
MGKLYSTPHLLTVMIVTKIALPKTIMQICDSAIRTQSLDEISPTRRIYSVYLNTISPVDSGMKMS